MSTQLIVQIILGALAALVVSIILAAIRNPLAVYVINLACALAAGAFIIVVKGLEFLIPYVHRFIRWLQQSISAGQSDFGFLDIVGPIMYLACFVVLILGDAYLTVIRLPLLFGGEPPQNLNAQLLAPFTAILWVTIFVSIAATTFDIFHLTHFMRLYEKATGKVDLVLKIAALVAFGLVILTAVLFGYFSKELTSNTSLTQGNTFVDGLLAIMFFVVLTVATIAAGPSLWYGIAPLLLFIGSVLTVVAHILVFLLSIPIEIIDRIAGLLVGLYDALALIGRGFWNYLHQLTEGKRGEIPAIAEPDKRDHIIDVFRLPGVA
jgi:hypothetical protein